MLHTVYSNSYEILRTYLMHSIGAKTTQSTLEPIRIISGSRLINNELMLSIAKEQGICAGIDFWTMNNWFRNYLGFGLSEGGQSQKFIWLLWTLLDDDFIQAHPRLKKYFEQREKIMDRDLLRYDFAKDVSTVFEKYINYRFDWVYEWAFPKKASKTVDTLKNYYQKQNKKERQHLENSADFGWQRALWEKLGQADQWTGQHTLDMFADWENLKRKTQSEPEEIHFFVPTNVSPLMLPIIKLLSEDPDRHVYAYLLNPCQNYWFGSYDKSQSKVSDYLRKNAASTRAMINRFNQFATEEEVTDQLHQLSAVNSLANISLQQLKLTTESEIERVDLAPDDGALLHDFQRAILLDSKEELPIDVNANDRSIRFIKSPTQAREVENLVNVIHSLFNDPTLPGLKADDILVVTPDIEEAAPVIEATFSTLPESQRISYKIVGRNAIDENMTGRALIELGRLFMTPMNVNQLESWLELPFVTQSLDLSLEDLNIIRDWLVTAGFRQGIDAEHLKNTRHIELTTAKNEPHEALDGTLDRALERLSWGFVLDQNKRESFDDILPVSSGIDTRFNSVSTEKRIFQTLLTLESKLKEAHRQYLALGDRANLDDIAKWGHSLIELFFANSSLTDKIALQSSLRAIDPKNSMDEEEATLEESLVISPAVYWRALEDTLGEEPIRQTITGAVTFAPLKLYRQIPFRVILAFGLNENSSFPGTQHFEEYDLMGVTDLKRQDDRDSRSDNRNAFLNLALSARDRFYCSWCIGTDQKNPANPSPVVSEFMYFLASNLQQSGVETDAKLKAITTQLPLSSASARNFKSDETRYWKSIDDVLLDSLHMAQETHFQAKEEPIVTGPLKLESFKEELNIEDLIAVYSNVVRWLEKKMQIRDNDDASTSEVPLLPPTDPLNNSVRIREWLTAFKEGKNVDDIICELSRNPLAGAVNTREIKLRDSIKLTHEAWLNYQSLLASAEEHYFEHLSTPIQGQYFKKLIANQVTLISTKETKEKLYLLDICPSVASVSRAQLKTLLLNTLLDKPVGMKVYSIAEQGWKMVEAPSRRLSKDALAMWLKEIENVVSVITYYDNTYDDDPVSILWRGSDQAAARSYWDSVKRDYQEQIIKSWIE